MASRRTFLRHLRNVGGGGHEPLAKRPSGSADAASQPQGRRSQSRLGTAGSAAATLVAVACAFGTMPDQAGLRDAAAGEAVATSRNTIDSFMSNSRRFLGL